MCIEIILLGAYELLNGLNCFLTSKHTLYFAKMVFELKINETESILHF